jgi:hypothetical protein
MKPICAMCGRPTQPFVMIGREAIGPKCAKKAGLTPAKTPKGSRLIFPKIRPVREDVPTTGDLFEGMDDDYLR